MDETRKKILAAARSILASTGIGTVTMRAVADRVGVTATALYRYFPDKDSLLAEVLQEDARLAARYLFPALEESEPAARLREAAEGYLRFAEEHPTLYRVLMEGESGTPASAASLVRQREALHRFLLDRVREVLRADAPGGAVEAITRLMLAGLHGIAGLPPSERPDLDTLLRAVWLLSRDRIAAPPLELT